MTYVAIAVLAVILPLALFDLAFRPGIRRIGVRNVARRPGEAALIILGSLLATALIVSSFIVGDSFRSSYRVNAEVRLGPLDQLVLPDDADADLAKLNAAMASQKVNVSVADDDDRVAEALIDDGSTIESLLPVIEGSINVANDSGKVEPLVLFWEAEPRQLKAFGNDPDASGVAGVPDDLQPDEVAINRELADELRVGVGDQVNFVFGQSVVKRTVAAVNPKWGLAGFAPVIATPGSLSEAFGSSDAFRASIAISNVGDTYQGQKFIPDTEAFLREVLGDESTITNIKDFTLRRADRIGDNTTSQFSTVGGFSVAAGILLMVNLFVMLASERKVDLGTMRAIGLQRGHTRRAFSVEGLVYGLAATVLGLLFGIAVAWVIIQISADQFSEGGELEIRLAVEPTSLFSGAVIGLAITQLTVLITAWRIVRINIVAALKDAVEARATEQSWVRIAIGVAGAVVGAGLWLAASDQQTVAFLAPILVAVGLIPLVSRLVGQKAATVAGCGLGIFWAAGIFALLPETFEDPNIELFLIQGIVLVALSVTILAAFDRVLIAGIRAVTRGSVESRLGLSNPMARPVRTAFLVSMYALVILTITFTAILNQAFTNQTPIFAAEAGGNYDAFILSSTLSPLDQDDLESRSDIDRAIEVESHPAMVRSLLMDLDDLGLRPGDPEAPSPEQVIPKRRQLSLISEDFAANGGPVLVERSTSYATDNAAWEAVAASESLAIVQTWRDLEVGDRFEIERGDGSLTELEVVGITDWNWISGLGIQVSDQFEDSLLRSEPALFRRHHIVAADGIDSVQLVEDLEADFARNGAYAESFIGSINEAAAETRVFIYILQGFLGLGLLIGIAGLCVVLIRGVRERRSQLGMLRALGFRASLLRNSFLIEALFVGLQGVMLGVGLGTLVAWQILTRSNAFGDGLEFVLPYESLGAFAVVALVASMLAGLFPAMQAARTAPAEALRLPT